MPPPPRKVTQQSPGLKPRPSPASPKDAPKGLPPRPEKGGKAREAEGPADAGGFQHVPFNSFRCIQQPSVKSGCDYVEPERSRIWGEDPPSPTATKVMGTGCPWGPPAGPSHLLRRPTSSQSHLSPTNPKARGKPWRQLCNLTQVASPLCATHSLLVKIEKKPNLYPSLPPTPLGQLLFQKHLGRGLSHSRCLEKCGI